MESNWSASRFSNLYAIPSRNGLTKPKRVRGKGVKFINMGEIFKFDRMKNIPTDRVPVSAKEFESSELENDDLLFARQSLILSGAGKCSIFLGDREPVVFESHLIRVRVDRQKIDPKFLYYFFQSPQGRAEIWAITEQGAGQAGIRGSDLETVNIPIPPQSEQKAIAHILGSLDDKIELNRQMNGTLESMAQVLFKSWFVDFDPVIDNALAAGNPIPDVFAKRAEQRKEQTSTRGAVKESENSHQSLFPSEFEFTEEMGWIPKGWGVGEISDIADHIRVNAKSEEIADSDMYVGLEHIGRKQIFLSNAGSGSAVSSNKSRFEKYDILFGKLRPYFHKVSIAPSAGICSTDILVFRPKKKALFSYLTLILFSEDLVDYSNMRATGTRMPRASAKDILSFTILKPPENLSNFFESAVSNNWLKGHLNNDESRSLSNLRDSLLPKLVSGEIRIPHTQKLIEIAS